MNRHTRLQKPTNDRRGTRERDWGFAHPDVPFPLWHEHSGAGTVTTIVGSLHADAAMVLDLLVRAVGADAQPHLEPGIHQGVRVTRIVDCAEGHFLTINAGYNVVLDAEHGARDLLDERLSDALGGFTPTEVLVLVQPRNTRLVQDLRDFGPRVNLAVVLAGSSIAPVPGDDTVVRCWQPNDPDLPKGVRPGKAQVSTWTGLPRPCDPCDDDPVVPYTARARTTAWSLR